MNAQPEGTEGIAPCAPHERVAALELLFCGYSPEDRAAYVQTLVSLAEADPQILAGLLQVRHDERLLGSALVQVQPGRTATVWPPRIAPGVDERHADALLQAMLTICRQHNVRIAQTLLPSDGDSVDAERLQGAGFVHLTDLLYLVSHALQFPDAPPAPQLTFEPYDPQQHARLADLIGRTYEGTLDCPQLEGVRDVDDVLAGYQATGDFDPNRWLFVRRDDRDIGCLLLARHPEQQQWELVYMGLVPEARGHGWGVQVARHAQWLARQAGCRQVVLAVDTANEPALRMYGEAGFVPWERRAVYVRIFD